MLNFIVKRLIQIPVVMLVLSLMIVGLTQLLTPSSALRRTSAANRWPPAWNRSSNSAACATPSRPVQPLAGQHPAG